MKKVATKNSEEASNSQNCNSPQPVSHNNRAGLFSNNTTRLIKNSISNGQLTKAKFNTKNVSGKDLPSPKYIKRNNSESHKTSTINKSKESSHLHYENLKNQAAALKSSKEKSGFQDNSSSTKIRVSSAKNSTLSPTKSNSVLTKSTNFKPSEMLNSDVKINKFDDKSQSKIQTISTNTAFISHSNSSRVKKRTDEKHKESNTNMFKII